MLQLGKVKRYTQYADSSRYLRAMRPCARSNSRRSRSWAATFFSFQRFQLQRLG